MSSGALAAAVVVPVVLVLLLLAGLLVWWLRSRVSGGVCCCGEASSKHSDSDRVYEGQDSSLSERGVSMTEYGQHSLATRSSSLHGSGWRSE